MNLYQLSNEFRQKVEEVEELMFLTDVDQEYFNDTIDSFKAPLEEKVENIVKYMRSLEALAEAKKAEAKRLSESAASDLKKVEFFKNYIANNLQSVGIKDLQAGIFKIGFRKGSEVVQIDESKIPVYEDAPHLYEVEPKLHGKSVFKKLLKENPEIEIPGVSIVRNPDSLVVK